MKQNQAPFIKAWIDGAKIQYKEQLGIKWRNLLPYQNSDFINIKATDELRFAPPELWTRIYVDSSGVLRSVIVTEEEKPRITETFNFISAWIKIDEYDSGKIEEARERILLSSSSAGPHHAIWVSGDSHN